MLVTRLECQYYSGSVLEYDGFPSLFLSVPDEKSSRSWSLKMGRKIITFAPYKGELVIWLSYIPNTSLEQLDLEYRYRLCSISGLALLNGLNILIFFLLSLF